MKLFRSYLFQRSIFSTSMIGSLDQNGHNSGNFNGKQQQIGLIHSCISTYRLQKQTFYFVKNNYVGVRISKGIRMIKRSEMRPIGGATFWYIHLPAVATILTPILVCLKPKILPIRWCHFL